MTTSHSEAQFRLMLAMQNPPETYQFTLAELIAIYGLLEHQYIHYDNLVGHAVINRIMAIIRANELATRSSLST